MDYRIHIQKFEPDFYSFYTPIEAYPNLPKRSLSENALIAGIDKMLDLEIADLEKVDIILSDEELSKGALSCIHLKWFRGDRFDPEGIGNWYRSEKGIEGWLCQVLFDYFTPCPMDIYGYVVEHSI